VTPPTVQFIPAVVAGENWRVDALCGTKNVSDSQMSLTSITESGESANFNVNTFNPVRRADGNTYIEFLMVVDTGGAYSSVSNFQSSTTNRQYSMSVDSVLLSHTSVTEVEATSTLLRVRLNCSAANGQAFWDDLDTSDDFVFTLTYD
jgi:hypothetical protein